MADPDGRAWPRVHALLEQYTPDGWLGRLLLGLVAGSVAGTLVPVGLFALGAFTFFSVLTGMLALPAGIAAAVVAVVTLWPVYLSLIGNLESAADYEHPAATTRRSSGFDADSTPARDLADDQADPTEEDSVALLKRRYAAGELSDEEFERRLGRLLDADERTTADVEAAPSDGERVLETDR